jgi:hypothetical protein
MTRCICFLACTLYLAPDAWTEDELVTAAPLILVENGRSEYGIRVAPDAEPAVKWAEEELRRVVKLATGADLKLAGAGADAPAIRLQSDASLPHDGFAIERDGRDVVIRGNDRLSPRDAAEWFVPSHGTLYGTLEFLERFVGARWLMPGELGEDVPRTARLVVALEHPLRGQPSFVVRSLSYLGESGRSTPTRPPTAVIDWLRRQRLTNGLHAHAVAYGHAWDDYLRPADMAAHPEWTSSNGPAVRNGRVQYFCTTAPGLVETFAQRVIDWLDRYPAAAMASISPTDGGGFCTCERCAKLVTTDPHGRRSYAAAILTFYQQVARIVQAQRPGRKLGGYVYYNYQYPPEAAPALPDNLSLCWAPLNYYGYGLLKPVYREEFEATLQRWSRITPYLVYHNYSTWMRSFHGAPLPVSLDIVKLELPAAARHGVWGAHLIGTSAWGVNAPLNYVLARQMWDAELDVSATLDEWLQRAYGPGWPHLRELYDALDAKMKQHKEAESPIYKGSQYEVNEDVMQAIYAPLFPRMEQLYQQTLAQCATDAQRKRLAMFGDNLIQLHFALREAALIADDINSMFRRDDAAFAKFLTEMETGFSLYRDDRGMDKGPIWNGEWRGP